MRCHMTVDLIMPCSSFDPCFVQEAIGAEDLKAIDRGYSDDRRIETIEQHSLRKIILQVIRNARAEIIFVVFHHREAFKFDMHLAIDLADFHCRHDLHHL